jgi:lysophospholipase L1-like esterase
VLLSPSPVTRLAARIAAGKPVRVLAIGSSSTEGAGATSVSAAYPARLEAELRQAWPVQVTVKNAGVGGETAPRTLERLRDELAGRRYDLVIWQVGTNDALRKDDEARFRASVEAGVDAAVQAGAELVFMDPQFHPGLSDAPRYERYVDIVSDVARTRKISDYSRFRLTRDWAQRDPDGWRSLYNRDGLHMNDAGYACVAAGMAASLEHLASGPRPVAAYGQ